MSLTEWVGVAVGILTIIGALLAGLSWLIRHIVREEVHKATQPIQPGYRNGGESLADVAALTRKIAEKVGIYE